MYETWESPPHPGAEGNPSADAPIEGFPIRAVVNGVPVARTVPSNRLLVDFLRDDLGLTGTKEGCGVGVCGVCSVIVDGRLTSACILLTVMIDRRDVTTIEGLGSEGGLSRLQHAFIDHGGFQCGICTPGQIVAASALLAEESNPSDDVIKGWMLGNLCRCTGYRGIIESIRAASGEDTRAPEPLGHE